MGSFDDYADTVATASAAAVGIVKRSNAKRSLFVVVSSANRNVVGRVVRECLR